MHADTRACMQMCMLVTRYRVCVQAIAQRGEDNLLSCIIRIALEARGDGSAARRFYGPAAADAAHRPRLEIVYEPPTTAEQLAWASERSCDVTVAVPTPPAPGAACVVLDAAAQRPLDDRPAACPHLELVATAATTSESCAMSVNGAAAPLNPTCSPNLLMRV